MKPFFLGLILALNLIVSSNASVSIVVSNFSFEVPLQGDGGFTPSSVAVPGWLIETTPGALNNGVHNPLDAQYTGTTGSPGTIPGGDGVQIAYVQGGTGSGWPIGYFQQDVFASLNPGGLDLYKEGTYTLTVSIGLRTDVPSLMGTNYIALARADNGAVLASGAFDSHAVTIGQFADVSVKLGVNDSSPWFGQNIRIFLSKTGDVGGQQVNFDNVRLDYVPEPSALLLLMAGGTLLWRKARCGTRSCRICKS